MINLIAVLLVCIEFISYISRCISLGLTFKVGFQVYLAFYITQHVRDKELMKSLTDYLNCGNIRKIQAPPGAAE